MNKTFDYHFYLQGKYHFQYFKLFSSNHHQDFLIWLLRELYQGNNTDRKSHKNHLNESCHMDELFLNTVLKHNVSSQQDCVFCYPESPDISNVR